MTPAEFPKSVEEAIALQMELGDKDWEIFFNQFWDDDDAVKVAYIQAELSDD